MNVEKQARNLICADDLNVPERRPGDYCPVCIAYPFSFTILFVVVCVTVLLVLN